MNKMSVPAEEHSTDDMPLIATLIGMVVMLSLGGSVVWALVYMGMTIPSLLHAHDYTTAGFIAAVILLIPALLIAGGQIPGIGAGRVKRRR